MDLITKNIARMLISTMGPEKIGNMSAEMIAGLIDQKNKIELDEGEADVIGVIYEIDGQAHFAQVAIRDNEAGETILARFISVKTVNEMLSSLLSNI